MMSNTKFLEALSNTFPKMYNTWGLSVEMTERNSIMWRLAEFHSKSQFGNFAWQWARMAHASRLGQFLSSTSPHQKQRVSPLNLLWLRLLLIRTWKCKEKSGKSSDPSVIWFIRDCMQNPIKCFHQALAFVCRPAFQCKQGWL